MRILFGIALLIIGLMSPFWVFVPCAIAYALWCDAYELILIGVFIDAQFSSFESVTDYRYTLVLGVLVIVLTLVKPYISYYDKRI